MQIPHELVVHITSLKIPSIIAISGFGGSGKSSLSAQLGQALSIPVISIDSFQKDGAFDTKYQLWEIMDYSRLEKEVLIPFQDIKSKIQYGHFDPGLKDISEKRIVENKGKLIIEGVGLFRPEIMHYFTYKIWIDTPLDMAIERGKRRDREEYGNPNDELWDGMWKNNDIQYMQAFNPQKVADYIVSNK